jgi:hypothetical protein
MATKRWGVSKMLKAWISMTTVKSKSKKELNRLQRRSFSPKWSREYVPVYHTFVLSTPFGPRPTKEKTTY